MNKDEFAALVEKALTDEALKQSRDKALQNARNERNATFDVVYYAALRSYITEALWQQIAAGQAMADENLKRLQVRCEETIEPAPAVPVAWIATHSSGRVIYFSVADGWQVEATPPRPNSRS